MRTNVRSAGIVIKDASVLLIERKKHNKHYFVFPGGGVEEGETPMEAVVREMLEETTIATQIEKLLYHITYKNKPNPARSEQYIYLCNYLSGKPALHVDSIEQKKMDDGHGVYIPQWVPLESIRSLELYPYEVRDKLMQDVSMNFEKAPYELSIEYY